MPLSLRRGLVVPIAGAALVLAGVGSASADQLTREQVYQVAAAAFPGDQLDTAVNVAWCESRFDTGARAPYGYTGLWQIDPAIHGWRAEALFGPSASLADPKVNAAVAAQIVAEQGWRPWPVCAGLAWGWGPTGARDPSAEAEL